MPLTILPDSDVRTLLHSFTRHDILELQQSLADGLHYYSTSTDVEDNGCCATYQPSRTALKRRDGLTTLFMPASSNEGLGVKIVTLGETGRMNTETGSSDRSSFTSSMSSLSISSSTPSTSTGSTGTSRSTFDLPPTTPASSISTSSSTASTTPRGSLSIFDAVGNPRGVINAEELTAFRTALASTALFKKRKSVHDVTVFGAGKQAYWHIRLALLLRGPEIHHLRIINRSFDRAQTLLEDIFKSETGPALDHPKIAIITPAHHEHERLLKAAVRDASVIFCTTPASSPLFPASYLTSTEGRKKGRYIAAVGSYKPHMIELHPDIVRQAVAPPHSHHHHKHAREGGAIIVDTIEGCLREAGEVVQAGLQANEVVELGELVMLKREAERRRREEAGRGSRGSDFDEEGVEIRNRRRKDREMEDEGDGGLRDWLERGNVIYKSVGLGLMDVVVGTEIVRLADERGVGVRIENF